MFFKLMALLLVLLMGKTVSFPKEAYSKETV